MSNLYWKPEQPPPSTLTRSMVPGGSRRNASYFGRWVTFADSVDAPVRALLTDAQTSGGLLIAVPRDRSDALMGALRRRGVLGAAIGELGAGEAGTIKVD